MRRSASVGGFGGIGHEGGFAVLRSERLPRKRDANLLDGVALARDRCNLLSGNADTQPVRIRSGASELLGLLGVLVNDLGERLNLPRRPLEFAPKERRAGQLPEDALIRDANGTGHLQHIRLGAFCQQPHRKVWPGIDTDRCGSR